MKYNCEAKQQAAQPILSIRTRTPVENLPQVLGQAYGKVMQEMGALGEQPCGYPFVIYYNMDMQALDIEVGFPVSGPLPVQGEVQSGTIPAGKVATCLYVGPYPEMAAAYEELNAWIAANGFQTTGTVYEHYLNSPMDTPPADLKTQIVFPLVEA
jgi:effector-binding domain-containing protein